MPATPISVYLDNNVWDFLLQRRIFLSEALPRDEFCVCITREAEFEIDAIPDCKTELKAFINVTIQEYQISSDIYFGFNDASLPHNEQRVGGFGAGRWAQSKELEFLAQQRTRLRAKNQKTKLFKNEADISIGARSFVGIILSLDAKKGPISDAHKLGGKVIFLTDFDNSGLSLADFIKAAV